MPLIFYDKLDEYGLMSDPEPHELPQNAWSSGQNVRFQDGAVEKFTGEQSVLTTPSASSAPLFAMYVPSVTPGLDKWLIPAKKNVYMISNATTVNNITPAGLTATLNATATLGWNGGFLGGGIYILNNGVEQPFQWVKDATSPQCAVLSNWPASATCRVIRPFKQFLVAGAIDEGTGLDETLLRWSHPATPGGVPSSWDYQDRTKDAGRVSLSQTPGAIVDMETLGDTNFIYKEDSVWSMQFVGGNSKFSFRRVFGDEVNIMAQRCVQQFFGGHVVLCRDDLIVHDGNQPKSVLTARARRYLQDNVAANNYKAAFLQVNYPRNEVWACLPISTTNPVAGIALIWNWKTNTITFRQLPLLTQYIARGGQLVAAGQEYTLENNQLLIVTSYLGGQLYAADQTEQFHGNNMSAYVVREAVPIGRQDPRTGEIRPDVSSVKYVTEVWPVIEGTPGGVVQVLVGARERADVTASYTVYNFTIGTDRKVDVRAAGKIIDIRFQSTTDITWKLLSYALNVRIGGRR